MDRMKDGLLHQKYIRASKQECIGRIIAGYENKTGDLSIRKLEKVCLTPRGACPYIVPDSNLLIDDCDYVAEISQESTENGMLEGKTLYGGFYRREWGHFLLNTTARLWPIYNSKINLSDFERIVFFVPDNDPVNVKGNFQEFFKLAGISEKVVLLESKTCFEELYIPDLAFEFMLSYSNECMGIFDCVRNRALSVNKQYFNKSNNLLLSRAHLSSCRGRQINIEYIDRLFAENGFEIIYPEEITLTELICKMDRANRIMTYSGSTAHNLILASDASYVVLERSAATNMPQIGVFLAKTCDNVTLVDVAYHPLITSSSDPLAIYGLTAYLKTFIEDSDYCMPADFDSMFCPKKELKEYMKYHKRYYGYKMGFNEWESIQYNAIIDAYYESLPRYRKWLGCQSPLRFLDWFSPRILYRIIKRVITRF